MKGFVQKNKSQNIPFYQLGHKGMLLFFSG